MKVLPILFSTQMVQAIMAGSKTQTRRIVKPQPYLSGGQEIQWVWNFKAHGQPFYFSGGSTQLVEALTDPELSLSPYGRQGDILWVREEHYRYGYWVEKEGVFTKTGRQKWMFLQSTEEILFSAPESFRKGRHHKDPYTPSWHKRLARFMPRSAARIFLKNTGERVEQLQNISPHDAVEEGIDYWNVDAEALEGGEFVADYNNYTWRDDPEYEDYHFPSFANPVDSFRTLWQSINGPNSWGANPWVRVVSFEKTEKPPSHETHTI